MAKGGWTKKPSEFMVQVEGDLTQQRRIITMEVLQGVVLASPVDKGTFRASHQVTVDAVSTSYDMSKQDKSGSATISDGLAAIASIDKPFGESTVQTNLPYAETLEEGHSAQAPSGVYRPTFANIRAKYAKS